MANAPTPMKISRRFNTTTPTASLVDAQTPLDKVFVVYHLGVPALDATAWRLTIDGLVERPTVLSLAELAALPAVEVTAFHECAGSPLRPTVPVRRVANVTWRGVRLKTLLDKVGVRDGAAYVWAYGADHGIYPPTGTHVDRYLKDLPLTTAVRDEVLLATQLNGEPLSEDHGAPVRLVVPGYYGTCSVKWLTGLRVSRTRADAFFTTTLYVDRHIKDGVKHARPVWDVAPNSLIVSPNANQPLERKPLQIGGWAWGASAIAAVDISTDDGATWLPAQVDARHGLAWQRFVFPWYPERAGSYVIASRATDVTGARQPDRDARHQIFRLEVCVAGA